MSDLIKIPSNLLSEISFEIKNIDCKDSNYESFEIPVEIDENVIESTSYSRSAWGRVEYAADFQGQELMLSFGWQADASEKDSYKDSFDFEVDFAYEPSEERNFIFVDEDGDTEDFSLEEIEDDAEGFEDFRGAAIPLLPVIEEDEVLVEVEVVEMEEVKEFIVERDNDVDLKFKGQRLAVATSKEAYNDRGRWFNLTLYQTIGGKYICQKEDVTCWQGERNRNQAIVCETIDEVKAFFGNGWVSKEIYEIAGIENFETIE